MLLSCAWLLISVFLGIQSPFANADSLILYANEPAPTAAEEQNLRTLLQWLTQSDVRVHHRVAELLAEDRKLFPEQVERDVLQLHTRLRDDPAWRQQGVVVFTNKLARAGQALWHAPGADGGVAPIAFAPPRRAVGDAAVRTAAGATADAILDAAPLSDAAVFASALALVAGKLDSPDQPVALIVKTHATGRLAVAPFAGTPAEASRRAELLAALPADDRRPPELATIGIAPDELLKILEGSSLRFDLVFLDAVFAAPSFPRLVTTSSSPVAKYQTIPYAALSPGGAGLGESLRRSIAVLQRAERDGEAGGPSSALRYLLLAPLLAGAALFVWLARRSSPQASKVSRSV